ncbi:MAG: fibronectin type III domain-containing protein, partial [Actinomycetes bacterium]
MRKNMRAPFSSNFEPKVYFRKFSKSFRRRVLSVLVAATTFFGFLAGTELPAFAAALNLTGLTISAGTLTPAFSATTYAYTVSEPNSQVSITVMPFDTINGGVIKVNGTTVSSGNSSGAIALSVLPASNTITIVNSQGANSSTYTLTVTRPDAVPGAPTLGVITPGNTQLSAAFTAGTNTGSAISTYQYSTDGGTSWRNRQTGSTASPILITTLSVDGTTPLTNGTAYPVQIRAVNAAGNSAATASTSATPDVAPGAPTSIVITPASAQLSVAFTPPAGNGGSAVTNYQYSTNGGTNWFTRTPASNASPLLITTLSTNGTTPLTNGTSYNIQIRALNTLTGAATATTAATPNVVPGAPTIGIITPGNTQLSVAFTAGTNTGSAVTTYQYTTDGTIWLTRQTGTTASPLVITKLSADGVTPLTNGTSYPVQIRAVNLAGNSAPSSTSSATPDVAPVAPTSIVITPGNAQLSVAFTPPAGNGGSAVTNYQYSTNGGTNWFTRTPASNASPLLITTLSTNGTTPLTNGTSYSIQIRAFNTLAGTATATTAATPATTAGAPTAIVITPGNAQLSVAFTAPASNGGSAITTYKYSTDGGATWLARQTGTTASPLVITKLSTDGLTALTNGTSYPVQIRAVNAAGDGLQTTSTSATPEVAPGAPTSIVITPGNAQLSVAFTAGANTGSAITTYQYSTNGGTNWLTRQTGTTGPPLVITTLSTDGITALTNGTSYNIRIRAFNTLAGTATATTASTPFTNAGAPTGIVITAGNAQLSVAFVAPASNGGSAITTYKYSTDGGATWLTRQTGTTASPLVITKLSSDGVTALTNGTSYPVQIVAVNGAGNGTATASTSATPITVAGAPTIGTATAGSSSATITYTAPVSNGGSAITLYTATSSPGALTGTLATAGSGTITVLGLTPGTAYTFTITATNGAGTSLPSAASNSVTPFTTQAALVVNSTAGTAGTGLSLTTTGGSGAGVVTYIASVGTAAGCTISAGVLSVTTPGTCTVTATKAANGIYASASSAPTTVTFS